jgi:hypothetical protein
MAIPCSSLHVGHLRCSTTDCRDRSTALSTRHRERSYLLHFSRYHLEISMYLPDVHIFEAQPSAFHDLSVQLYLPNKLSAG